MEKVILVDFFDTIMFRHVHPFQVIRRWCELIVEKIQLKTIDTEKLFSLRQRLIKILLSSEEVSEVRYDAWMSLLYKELVAVEAETIRKVALNDFLKICKEIEMAVEYGVQYPNRKLLNYLTKRKKKYRICIVSDFYLSKDELISFMKAKNIDTDLFDNIYCSHDYNATKEKGSLYDIVLKDLGFPTKVTMIGDNYNNDYLKAVEHSIRGGFCPRLLYKLKIKIKKKCGYDYGTHILKIQKKSA